MFNVNTIKIIHGGLTRNNAFRGYFVYPFMERGRKLLQTRALQHWIERASINRLILIIQFSIFARKCTFSQSGSHIHILGRDNVGGVQVNIKLTARCCNMFTYRYISTRILQCTITQCNSTLPLISYNYIKFK